MSAARTPVDVAAGILIRADGRFLLASRPAGKPYASYWEFPGGKVEAGEAIAAALARELREELGIEIETPYPWVVRTFDYPHALVRLHFFRVFDWRGELRAREHQEFGFFSLRLLPEPLLPATIPVLRWLDLPSIYAITAISGLGRDVFLQRLESALERGLRLLQFREPALDSDDAASIFKQVLARARAYGATVLINSRHHPSLWELADGVHLTAADAARTTARPTVAWVGASAHSAAEVERAAALGIDLLVVGPVRQTATHPGRAAMGWSDFADVVANSPMPAYALGGMQVTDVVRALRHRAHGVASLSAVWSETQCFATVSRPGASSGSASFSGAEAIE